MALEQGWYGKAREYFERALELDATNREAIDGLARAKEILSRKAATAVGPTQYSPVKPPPEVDWKRGVPEKRCTDRQLKLTPGQSNSLPNSGLSATLKKRFYPKPAGTSTWEHYSDAQLKRCWSSARSLIFLGECAINSGDPDFARRCFQRVVELDPGNSEAWFWLGFTTDNPQDAIACYEKSIETAGQDILDEDRVQRAQEGISFERTRIALGEQRHRWVARARKKHPKSDFPGNVFDESAKPLRKFWNWLEFLGFAGTWYYRVCLPDGREGYVRWKDVVLDVVPIDQPCDLRNVKLDMDELTRVIDAEVIRALDAQQPHEAIQILLQRIPELQDSAALAESVIPMGVARLYEKAGDIAYMYTGDMDQAFAYWSLACETHRFIACDKVESFAIPQSPDDVSPQQIRDRAKRLVNLYVGTYTDPDLYKGLLGEKGEGITEFRFTDLQRTYAEELSREFEREVNQWEADNDKTLVDGVAHLTEVKSWRFTFGFVGTVHWQIEERFCLTGGETWLRELMRELYRNVENRVRRRHGLPLRGARYRETLLYETVCKVLPDHKVVRQAEAWEYLPWLAPQHVDIYVPTLRLGIEYMGEQHFEPIAFFGGEEEFKYRQELDERKRQLFENHNIPLIYVLPEDEITEESIRQLLAPYLNSK